MRPEYAPFLRRGLGQKKNIAIAAISRILTDEPTFGLQASGQEIIMTVCYELACKVAGRKLPKPT